MIQIGLSGVPPFTGVSLRFAIAGLLLLILTRSRGVPLGTTRRERTLWLVNGMCSFAVAYGAVYWAEQWVPSGLAAVLFSIYPLLVAMLAHFLLPGERMRRREALGVLLAFVGIGVIFSEDLASLGGPQVVVGAVVLLLSPLASAFGSVSVKRWGGGIHPLSLAAVPMLVCAVVTAVPALAFERGLELRWNAVTIAALLYLAIVGSALTFTVYFWLLAQMPAKRLALIAYVIPMIAVGIGVLRGEPLTTRMLVGAAGVVAGLVLATAGGPSSSRPRRDPVAPRTARP